jgi:hypothetical protein
MRWDTYIVLIISQRVIELERRFLDHWKAHMRIIPHLCHPNDMLSVPILQKSWFFVGVIKIQWNIKTRSTNEPPNDMFSYVWDIKQVISLIFELKQWYYLFQGLKHMKKWLLEVFSLYVFLKWHFHECQGNFNFSKTLFLLVFNFKHVKLIVLVPKHRFFMFKAENKSNWRFLKN